MSEFSGKCDLWDDLINIAGVTDEYDWSNMNIFLGKDKLDIKSVKDLVPYAAYISSSIVYNKDIGYSIHLSQESFVDMKERESLMWRLKRAKKYYRKCKCEGIEFIVFEAVKYVSIIPDNCDYEICRRVAEHPYTNNIRGIHTNIHNFYRKELYNAMLEYGYSEIEAFEWCFKNYGNK